MSSRRERIKRTRPRNEPYKRQGFNENKYKRVSLEQTRKLDDTKKINEAPEANVEETVSEEQEENLNEIV